MLTRGMSRAQIEDALKGKGDFVKIDYLTKFLREELNLDIKKFVYLELAEIYQERGMLDNAAKMFGNAAVISVAVSEKIKFYLKEIGLCVKTGKFEEIDKAVKNAMRDANASQKAEILFHLKSFYLRQAEIYEVEMKRKHAAEIYEQLLKMNLSGFEKKEITKKLILIYEKLGKFKEVEILKKMI